MAPPSGRDPIAEEYAERLGGRGAKPLTHDEREALICDVGEIETTYLDWLCANVERIAAAREDKARAEGAAEVRAAVEALADECETQHGQCWNSIFARRLRNALADSSSAAEVLRDAADDLEGGRGR